MVRNCVILHSVIELKFKCICLINENQSGESKLNKVPVTYIWSTYVNCILHSDKSLGDIHCHSPVLKKVSAVTLSI
jgi:hypothetical protein